MRFNKFNAKITELDGIKFHSKKEAKYWQDLGYAKKSGELLFALRQVPLHLPGNVRYVVDFLEFWKNGDVRFVDVKGFKTQAYIMKKKIAEAIYPITILEM